jgi:amino acid transporter, AAT family
MPFRNDRGAHLQSFDHRESPHVTERIIPEIHVRKSLDEETLHAQEDLHRGLKERHVRMIAIGGTIGVGLFLGSATAIQKAGPGLVVSYAIGGLVMFFIMRALGELLLYRPVTGSFAIYADEFVGPWAGFITGWSYWFMWVVIGMAEITAVGLYVHYWFPGIPQWVPALITLGLLYSANLITVKVFGEIEFWFALIKVVTIVAMIVIGLTIIVFKFGNLGETASFSNLWMHGGFFPFGALGVLLSLQMVMFAYQGLELIGVSAGETENPEKVLPRAINSVVYRMLVLYIGPLLIIMSLVAWNQLSPDASPFVSVFERIKIPAGAGIINFVVITAGASSCNSGIFSTGRMLYSLARVGQAPRAFGKVSSRNVPAAGVTASATLMLIGVALNYIVPEQVFVYVTSISLVGSLWTWALIVIAHLGYRKAVATGEARAVAYLMPGSPYTNWFVVVFLVLVAILLSSDERTRVALYVAPVWFIILGIGYQIAKRRAAQVA